MSDTFLVQPHLTLQTPPLSRGPIHLEDDEDDNVFNNSVECEISADAASIRAMASSRSKMESAMRQFSYIFAKLEDHMKKASSDSERSFIKKQIKNLVDGAKQIDYMMSDLSERVNRMEKFLENRNKGLDWNLWENQRFIRKGMIFIIFFKLIFVYFVK